MISGMIWNEKGSLDVVLDKAVQFCIRKYKKEPVKIFVNNPNLKVKTIFKNVEVEPVKWLLVNDHYLVMDVEAQR